MKTFDKILAVLGKNIGYTVVLIAAAVLFLYFSNGLIEGIIAAVSALVAYACIVQLVREYKKFGTSAMAPAKPVKATKKKPAAKKAKK